jgi:hypothetical protein
VRVDADDAGHLLAEDLLRRDGRDAVLVQSGLQPMPHLVR